MDKLNPIVLRAIKSQIDNGGTIGITGDKGSGKTTFARRLEEMLIKQGMPITRWHRGMLTIKGQRTEIDRDDIIKLMKDYKGIIIDSSMQDVNYILRYTGNKGHIIVINEDFEGVEKYDISFQLVLQINMGDNEVDELVD